MGEIILPPIGAHLTLITIRRFLRRGGRLLSIGTETAGTDLPAASRVFLHVEGIETLEEMVAGLLLDHLRATRVLDGVPETTTTEDRDSSNGPHDRSSLYLQNLLHRIAHIWIAVGRPLTALGLLFLESLQTASGIDPFRPTATTTILRASSGRSRLTWIKDAPSRPAVLTTTAIREDARSVQCVNTNRRRIWIKSFVRTSSRPDVDLGIYLLRTEEGAGKRPRMRISHTLPYRRPLLRM